MSPVTTTFCALLLGTGLGVGLERLSVQERTLQKLPLVPIRLRRVRIVVIAVLTAAVCSVFQWASLVLNCLESAEVQPSGEGQNWRLVYHLTLLVFLILATAIDFDCYVIPDIITVPGTLIGVFGACLIREAQICHLWVDWSIAVPQLRGPLIPDWYDAHRFWHALAWSLTGMMTGAGLTYIARQVSSQVLGMEAMGFGDVTLMAMIGSFLGWQAVTLVFLIAPLAGLTIGVIVRMLTGKTYLPYGPWLSIAAGTVLFAWSHLWRQTRLIFSDWLSVVILSAIGGFGFVVLLILVRLYKSIPTRRLS